MNFLWSGTSLNPGLGNWVISQEIPAPNNSILIKFRPAGRRRRGGSELPLLLQEVSQTQTDFRDVKEKKKETA